MCQAPPFLLKYKRSLKLVTKLVTGQLYVGPAVDDEETPLFFYCLFHPKD